MGIFDAYLPKPKTMIKRKITFNLIYDAEEEKFDPKSTFHVHLVAADGTQAESFSLRVSLLGITVQERTQLEAFFQGKVETILLNSGYTIDPTGDPVV